MLDADKAGYVIQYYRHLMTPQEWRADGHLRATAKLTYGRILKAAQLEAGIVHILSVSNYQLPRGLEAGERRPCLHDANCTKNSR